MLSQWLRAGKTQNNSAGKPIDFHWGVDVMDGITILIGVLALGFTLWQIFFSKRHNKLSLKPEIDLRVYELDSDNFKILLLNNGLGAAFLTKVSFTHNNRTYSLFNKTEFKLFVEQLYKVIPETIDLTYYLFDYSTSIAGGDELLIFEVKNSAKIVKKISAVMRDVRLDIEYQCLYKKNYRKALYLS